MSGAVNHPKVKSGDEVVKGLATRYRARARAEQAGKQREGTFSRFILLIFLFFSFSFET